MEFEGKKRSFVVLVFRSLQVHVLSTQTRKERETENESVVCVGEAFPCLEILEVVCTGGRGIGLER